MEVLDGAVGKGGLMRRSIRYASWTSHFEELVAPMAYAVVRQHAANYGMGKAIGEIKSAISSVIGFHIYR